MTLKSLDRWNWERAKRAEPGPRKNGIACPDCGAELVDDNPDAVFTSDPPQVSVKCQECSFSGYRNL